MECFLKVIYFFLNEKLFIYVFICIYIGCLKKVMNYNVLYIWLIFIMIFNKLVF